MQKRVLNSIFSLEIVSSWYFLLLIINVKKVFGQKSFSIFSKFLKTNFSANQSNEFNLFICVLS